jgi:signal transduction histidine kinase
MIGVGLVALTTFVSHKLLSSNRIDQAARIYVGGTIFAINVALLHPGSLTTPIPYAFLLIIALSGSLIAPGASFITALLGIATSAIAVSIPVVNLEQLTYLIAPGLLALLTAAVTWGSAENLTTAFNWAVDSQSRAASRRDELFESQQALKMTNALLESANTRAAEAQKQAEEANETKTKFITNLSHELRTPLNAIINFSYILAHAPVGNSNFIPLTESQRNYLTRIQNAGEHLLSIVNDLLDLAKIEAGQMHLLAEEVELEAVCQSALQLIEGLIDEKPIELRVELPPDLPNVIADSTRLRQILFNLLSNAAKYTNEGHISLRAKCLDSEVVIAIEDTGIGIKKEEFEAIFKEFHQTEEAIKHKRLGTGLGLPISKKFIEMHGGRIWVESEVNVGSTFYFTVPLVIPEPTFSDDIDLKEAAPV